MIKWCCFVTFPKNHQIGLSHPKKSGAIAKVNVSTNPHLGQLMPGHWWWKEKVADHDSNPKTIPSGWNDSLSKRLPTP
jgi:hypothetical protein